MSYDTPQSQTWILLEVLGAPDMFEEDRFMIGFVEANELLHRNSFVLKTMTKYVTAFSQEL